MVIWKSKKTSFVNIIGVFGGILFASEGWSIEEGMSSMPKILPKKIYSLPSKEEAQKLFEQRGYGKNEAEVRMMNLMMVGGSEMEGMDMSEMEEEAPDTSDTNHNDR